MCMESISSVARLTYCADVRLLECVEQGVVNGSEAVVGKISVSACHVEKEYNHWVEQNMQIYIDFSSLATNKSSIVHQSIIVHHRPSSSNMPSSALPTTRPHTIPRDPESSPAQASV
jgi:hypothetical protein